MPEENITEQFIANYLKEYDYYQEVARICHDQCEALLGLRGIRAIVTHRAKNPIKLQSKLEQRKASKAYSSIEDVRADIIDLAGVRIALYFPGDRPIVGRLIEETFDVKIKKIFPDLGKKKKGKIFEGYYADHFRVQLPERGLSPGLRRFSGASVEIQLGSVLMHAWAEVEHDLVYKPDSGQLSDDEHAILDLLNGLVLSGEIALQRLQRAMEWRLSRKNATFDSHYELAAYLHKATRDKNPNSSTPMGRVDALWQILKEVEKNTVKDLDAMIEQNCNGDEDTPLADQLADSILESHPEIYSRYIEIQGLRAPYTGYEGSSGEKQEIQESLVSFLNKWITLEKTFLQLSGPSVGRRAPKNIEEVANNLGLPATMIPSMRRLRLLRNDLVHGVSQPTIHHFREAHEGFKEIFAFLEGHSNPAVRSAYQKAQKENMLRDLDSKASIPAPLK